MTTISVMNHDVLIDECDLKSIRFATLRVVEIGNRLYCQIWRYTNYVGLHTYLTGYVMCDHKNGNGLDNRRDNLRETNHVLNGMNRSKQYSYGNRRTSSQYKGVSFHSGNGKWYARIAIDKKQKHLGYFDNEMDAAIAYDMAAIQYYGEYSNTNIINYR